MSDISFTFGIVAYVNEGISQCLIDTVSSIRRLNIPQYEIIIVGSERHLRQDYHFESHWKDLRIIDFDENHKRGWITKKKNLISQLAKYENVVFLHDYINFLPGWYEGFKRFGDHFQICMNKIINFHPERGEEENRFRDLVLDTWDLTPKLASMGIPKKNRLIPYHHYDEAMTPYMYISGAYWVAKKSIMLSHPLDERLVWGAGEDVDWSKKVRDKYKFSFNPHSVVQVGKPNNHRIFDPLTEEEIIRFKNHYFPK